MKETLLLSLLALAACGGDDDKHSDAAMHADLSASGPDMLPVDTFTIYEVDGPSDGGTPPEATNGVTISWANHPEIVDQHLTGGGEGSIAFPAQPATGELLLAFVVTPINPTNELGSTVLLHEESVAQEGISTDSIYTAAYATSWLTAAGFTYPTTTGFIDGRVFSDGNDVGSTGATVTITPASGKVVYRDANGVLDPTLTATSSNGSFMIGNVTPGNFTLTFNAPGKTCQNPAGPNYLDNTWPSTTPQSVEGYVAAGTLVERLNISCQ